jgi:hypothetical protein
MIKEVFQKIVANLGVALFVAMGATIWYLLWERKHINDQHSAEVAKVLHDSEVRDGAIAGKLESQARVIAAQTQTIQDFVKRTQAIDANVKTVAGVVSKILTRGAETLRPESPVVGTLPSAVFHDDYHRFTFALPEAKFSWQQSYRYNAIFLTNPNGTKVMRDEFVELDPMTGAAIPGTPPKLETSFTFTKDEPSVPALHLRMVGGVESHGNVLVGVQLVNLERYSTPVLRNLNLGALLAYDRRAVAGTAAGYVGYRLFNSNVSAGLYYGASTAGGTVSGLLLTINITR